MAHNDMDAEIAALEATLLPSRRERKSPLALLEERVFHKAAAALATMPKRLNHGRRVHRRLTIEQKRLIVYLRYGQMRDFGAPANKVSDVAEYLRTPWCTVNHVLRKFVAGGHDLAVFARPRRFAKIDAALGAYLLDPKTLQEWLPHTLVERSRVLKRARGVVVSPTTLRRFYKANGLRYVTGRTVYRAAVTHSARLDRARVRFGTFLGNVLAAKKPLVYQDETTFNTWQLKAKSWALPGVRNEHARPGPRYSVTVYGAIGACLTQPVFSLGDSTNQVEFRQFVRKVKRHQKATVAGKPLLFVDGHAAHLTPESKKAIEAGFHCVKNVPYTCELNSIETYWSVAKAAFAKLMLAPRAAPLTREGFEAAVWQALASVSAGKLKKILTANRRYVKELIQKAAKQEEAAFIVA